MKQIHPTLLTSKNLIFLSLSLLLTVNPTLIQCYRNTIHLEEGAQLDQFDWINERGKFMEAKTQWPEGFSFPINYQAELVVYWNTHNKNGDNHQYEFNYKHIVDTVNNRLKKNMCLRYDLEDMSPPSLERRDQPLNLKYMMEDTWTESRGLTDYLGKYRFTHYKNDYTKNRQTFVEPDQDLKKSSTGAYTFYYFNEKLQLVGGATVQEMNNAEYFFNFHNCNLFNVNKIQAIQPNELKHSTLGGSSGKYEIEFVLVECIEDYFKDEYMLINGYHLVRLLHRPTSNE